MLSEIRSSLRSSLTDRVTNPIWGALIISWLIWNWKIVYLTLFVDSDKLKETKLDYIVTHLAGWRYGILYPVLSTIGLVVVFPFLSDGAYWLAARFEKWRYDQGNKIQEKKLLSIEASIALRQQMRSITESFQKILEEKDVEITRLREIERQHAELTDERPGDLGEYEHLENQKLAKQIAANPERAIQFRHAYHAVMRGDYHIQWSSAAKTGLPFFVGHDLIERGERADQYQLTSKGKEVMRLFEEIQPKDQTGNSIDVEDLDTSSKAE